MIKKLKPEELRKICDLAQLEGYEKEKSAEIREIIGQDRGVKALKFGLGNKAQGFNVYVSGSSGTDKMESIVHFLEDLSKVEPSPHDWCYVNNFKDSYWPKKLRMSKGTAVGFKTDMTEFVKEAKDSLIKVMESEEFGNKRKEIFREIDKDKSELLQGLDQKAREEGFVIQRTPIGLLAMPLKDGKPVNEKTFNALEREEQEKIADKQSKMQNELENIVRPMRQLDKEAGHRLRNLEKDSAMLTIEPLIAEIRKKYKDNEEIVVYLEDIKTDILNNLESFIKEPRETDLLSNLMSSSSMFFRKYEVNVLVDNTDQEGAPLVVESNPTYNNLFGKVEKESQMGMLITDFTLIRNGSLHRANGGYLVIQVEDMLRNLLSYDSLKRALRNKEVEIEEPGEKLGLISIKGVKPETIPLNVKVVLVGDPMLYNLLYQYDKDFRELFKVKAEFDTVMDLNPENLIKYTAFVSKICKDENLPYCDNEAMAKMVEFGSRLADSQDKISTMFGDISDVVREAGFYVAERKGEKITAKDIIKTVEEKNYRSNLIQEKINELIQKNIILIDIKGEKVGQVNGISVMNLGDFSFGRPSRITVNTGVGKDGLINIEREAELSGPIHTKGVMILSGYLMEKFAQNHPLSLTASIVFEQSYGQIDGDSASSTELYALLSNLSGLPLKQSIGVTGSVNQKGEIQPVGGINEKIEGYFEVCKRMGLTGDQGVIIPAANERNLMLKEEILEAVKNKKFNIWSVNHIDEGIEILTGVEGGKRDDDGYFEEETVNYRVETKMNELTQKMKDFINIHEELY